MDKMTKDVSLRNAVLRVGVDADLKTADGTCYDLTRDGFVALAETDFRDDTNLYGGLDEHGFFADCDRETLAKMTKQERDARVARYAARKVELLFLKALAATDYAW